MKKLLPIGLGALIALMSSCASVSSTYNKHQELRPRAAQSKALATKALQIKTSAEGQEVFAGVGVDWTKMNVSVLDTFKEDPVGMSTAVGFDALKAAALAWGVKYINDEYLNKDSGESTPTGPAIQATGGGRISVNNAPDGAYKDHTLKANGQNSSIDLNFVAPEKEAEFNNAPFNLDGTPNLDGKI